jgi:hypothetical protein
VGDDGAVAKSAEAPTEMRRASNGQHYNQPIERGGVTADAGR